MNLVRKTLVAAACLGGLCHGLPAQALDYEDYPIVKLRTLDKVTARTMTFEAKVGATMKFGEIYIKVQTCRKPPPVQKSEASAFLQIWETDTVKDQSRWIFSGWMFASSPTLSAMDHPVYDVWVIDCLGKDPEALPPPQASGDGTILPPGAQPATPPADELGEHPGEHGDSAAPSETTDTPQADTPASDETSADDTESGETIPASNLPQDAEPIEDEAPVSAPEPQAETPAETVPTPAPDKPDSFQGIY